MSKETGKSTLRRFHDIRFSTRYFVGDGIDIGAGDDPLSDYSEFFPLIKSLRPWDMPDGDAQYMHGVKDDTYDFVHSSHCLEHVRDPQVTLGNWIRICKPGGYLVLVVPDEDLYEQGVFPSTFNGAHLWTYTIKKNASWCDRSVNVFDLLSNFVDKVHIHKVELLDATFRYNKPRFDQTDKSFGDCAIEIILKKT